MQMPKPDQDSLAKRARIVEALRAIVPGEGVIASRTGCAPTSPTG